MPAVWMGAPPEFATPKPGTRRPVVVVADTPVATHPWLPDEVVDRAPTVAGEPLGEVGLRSESMMDNSLLSRLQSHAGHGTFIAGLVRQRCPSARILSVSLFGADGVVSEVTLLNVLAQLVVRQVRARRGLEAEEIDVVSLSLGYYHEAPEDEAYTVMLASRVRALGLLGITVVASAGNDATVRPALPAAFAPGGMDGEPVADRVPLVAVGALNPDGTSALFSNDGPWVTAWRPGVMLLSTFPRVDAGESAAVETVSPWGMQRASLDPDDFSRGFAMWSGTSFAAPLFAAETAAQLDAAGLPSEDVICDRVARAWDVLASMTELRRP